MSATLSGVVGEVRLGRVVYLSLTGDQKRALRDPDGQIALDVLRHLLGARAGLDGSELFPLTEFAFQSVARKLGRSVGQKRARRLIARLLDCEIVVAAGSSRRARLTPRHG